MLRRCRFVLISFFIVCLGCAVSAQSLYPNADSEAVFQKTIAGLNKGTITAGEAYKVFMVLIERFRAPSSDGIHIYGAHAWKLSMMAQSAYLHRLSEAAVAAALENALGREAAASAWAQQLKYANIHKEAKRKLEAALK